MKRIINTRFQRNVWLNVEYSLKKRAYSNMNMGFLKMPVYEIQQNV